MKKYESYKDSGVQWIGEVPSHWDVAWLKRHASIKTGCTPSTKESKYYDTEDIDWFTPGDISTFSLHEANKKISELAKKEGACRMFPPKTIYFVGIGATIGKVAICEHEASANQQINAVIVDKDVDYKYFAYCLTCQKEEIYLTANTVTLPIINQDKTGTLRMPIPTLKEQLEISSFLDKKCEQINNIISAQQKRIDILSELRQTIITKAVTKGIKDTQSITSGIEWVSKVPSHWQIMPLKQTTPNTPTTFMDGDWIESKNISEDGIRYLTSGNVGKGEYKEQGDGFITEETFKELDCLEVFPGDVLISRLNLPSGRSCIIPDLGYRIVTCVDNVIYRPFENLVDKEFMVYQMNCAPYAEYASNKARGATMQRITRNQLGALKVLVPPLEEQKEIVSYLKEKLRPIEQSISKAQRQIEILTEYKQSLITEVVTGKRKVC